MRILIAPDSLKGSLTAEQVCHAVAAGIRAEHPDADVDLIPIADGGEGTVEAFALACPGADVREVLVTGPLGQLVTARWALLPDNRAALAMAEAAGLPLVGEDLRTHEATTFGVGELLLAAAHAGASEILLGLGGSATTDGGCGAAAACGVQFFDDDDQPFTPVGASLHRISRIAVPPGGLLPAGVRVQAMCDVDNPLTGPHGAAAVFGPQKGASEQQVEELDAGLAHLAELLRRDLGVDVEDAPGAGAAGGLGAAMLAFFGAELVPGAEAVLDATGFDNLCVQADAVVTAEGAFDYQSWHGKAVMAVATRAQRAEVPVHVLAGRVEDGMEEQCARHGVVSARAIAPEGTAVQESMARAEEFLRAAAAELAREHLMP